MPKAMKPLKTIFSPTKYILITPTLLCSQEMQVQNNCYVA